MIDADGRVVYLSAAMKERFEIGDEIPESIQNSLQPSKAAWRVGNQSRGHQTLRLTLDPSGSSTSLDARPETVTAHFVRMGTLHAEAFAAQDNTAERNQNENLILGCLGEYLSDADVPWQVWFASDGVREASRVAEKVNRMRADRIAHANLLLAGDSTASRRLRDRVNLAGQLRCHVALVGQAGCGFAELASSIHHQSQTSPSEPYVCLDASLMDAELLEAYASPAIAPLSHSPDAKSTLCLQRFDEMPEDGQDRLIKWLQTWPDRLRLIGLLSTRFVTQPNVEFSFATELVDAMSLFTIELPSLRSRNEDLATIAQSLVDTARLSRDAIELIENYPWPGQWDEMIAAMQFARQAVRGERVTRDHLPLAIRSFRPTGPSTVAVERNDLRITIRPKAESPDTFQIESLDETLRTYEKTLIERAMVASDGNKAEAARRLGISRTRLLRKLADE